ncbi:glycosyl hydrolase [Timonella senegalensis]|uniref:glycosyl hydrolase n=1 Tax=Timonella senegalensis TaxID=1465825 RepID=UPI00068468AF|nr:glycosyl hydrolase [Timonella senegalensis]
MNPHLPPFSLQGHNLESLNVEESVVSALSQLQVDTIAQMPWLHAVDGMLPPTNRWFSPLAFGSPDPVFPMPLSYIQTNQGFVFGLPRVTSSRHTVSSPAAPDIDVNVGASSYRIARHDLGSITVEFLNSVGRVLGHAVIAEGVPYVSYTADVAHDVSLSVPFTMKYESCAIAEVEGQSYGLVTSGAYSSRSIRLVAGQFLSLIAFPRLADSATPAEVERSVLRLAQHASFPVSHVSVAAGSISDDIVTTVRYVAAENGPVAVVRMPHHFGAAGDILGEYETVDGTLPLISAKVLEWRTPRVSPAAGLDLDGVPADVLEEIRAQVVLDLAVPERAPVDSYFGGKALVRDAQLARLADQLGVAGADEFRAGFERRLTAWAATDMDSRTFFFDDVWMGVVGREPSFGAEEFNDHHTQYGYFMYAAALAVEANAALLEVLESRIDALAFDVASPVLTDSVPQLRVFDPYKGHSWASGRAPFDEGNNQESISEAVNSWNGLALWAKVTGREWLADLAQWLLSLEAASAQSYWLNFDRKDPVRLAYKHSIAPLVWGAKHDYATWFSGEKSAMLGILLLPMSPVSVYLAQDAERILDNLEEVVGYYDNYAVTYGDYLVMYAALAGGATAEKAWQIARDFEPELVDDGNSKAYMMAWVASRRSY